MPVTARLSNRFYERFGDEIANELVDWFNAVDMTYQAQLKEVNELNWARADVRFSALGDRLGALSASFDVKLDALESRIDAKLNALESRIDAKLDALESRFDAKLNALESRFDARLQRLRSELILWMFGFWTATVIPLVALMLSLSGTFRD